MSRNTRRAVVLVAISTCWFMLGISAAQAGGVPATIAKAFNPASITAGGTSTITFTLGNANVAVALKTGIGNFQGFAHRVAHVDRPECQLRRMREVVDLRDDAVQAIDLPHDDFAELLAKIGIVETLGQ